VIRVIRNDVEGIRVEHFWLCGSCHRQYDFCFSNDKGLSFVRRQRKTCPERQPELQWIEEGIASYAFPNGGFATRAAPKRTPFKRSEAFFSHQLEYFMQV
jgi:hypothetical protein